MNSVLLIIILVGIFSMLSLMLISAVIAVAERRIKKARTEAEVWKELYTKANAELEEYRPREINI